MKKSIIVLLLCLPILHVVQCSALSYEPPSCSPLSKLVNIGHTAGKRANMSVTRNFNRLKNLSWTKTRIAKIGIIVAIAVVLYGVYHYFSKQRDHHATNVIIPATQAIPETPLAETSTVVDNSKITTKQSSPLVQLSFTPTAEQSAVQPTIEVAPMVTIAPITPEIAPIVTITPITPIFMPAPHEKLAVVPYFANRLNHLLDPMDFQNSRDNTHVTVQQLTCSFPNGKESEASSGYHAGPKNLLAIVGIIKGHNTAEMLTDYVTATKLSCPTPSRMGWLRAKILNKRKQTLQGSEKPIADNGEMLESQEIAYLINLQGETNPVLHQALDPSTVSINIIEETTPESLNKIAEITDLRDKIMAKQLPEKRIYAFVLDNVSQHKSRGSNWVTMVLELVHNHHRYTIADSANNPSHMFSGACHNLIKYLEGNEVVQQQLVPAQSLKKKLLERLMGDIKRCEAPQTNKQLSMVLQDTLALFQELVGDYSSFGGREQFYQRIAPLLPHNISALK